MSYQILPPIGPQDDYAIELPQIEKRRCAVPGCGTILRRSNSADRCEVHKRALRKAVEESTDYDY